MICCFGRHPSSQNSAPSPLRPACGARNQMIERTNQTGFPVIRRRSENCPTKTPTQTDLVCRASAWRRVCARRSSPSADVPIRSMHERDTRRNETCMMIVDLREQIEQIDDVVKKTWSVRFDSICTGGTMMCMPFRCALAGLFANVVNRINNFLNDYEI
jgi:hypothetical protein